MCAGFHGLVDGAFGQSALQTLHRKGRDEQIEERRYASIMGSLKRWVFQ